MLCTLVAGCVQRPDPNGFPEFPDAPVADVGATEIQVPSPADARPPSPPERPAGGQHRWTNGAGLTYEGEWLNGLYHGTGTLREPDGSRYVGEWENGKRSGSGKQYWPDGTYHDGAWELNQPQGPGSRRDLQGIVRTGGWTGSVMSNGLVGLPSGHTYAGRVLTHQGRRISTRYLAWLRDLAERGDRYAQMLLAECYAGQEFPEPDPSEQRRWLEASSAQGHAPAQFALSTVLVGDEGERWLRKAAEGRNTRALHALARLEYRLGRYDTSLALARQASELGNVPARLDLAWWLATAPGADKRSGGEAVALVRDIAITYGRWQYLDTFAAALARTGAYDRAAETAIKAHEGALAAGEPDLMLQRINARRQTYERREPFTTAHEEQP